MQRTKKNGKTKQRHKTGHLPARGRCPDDGKRIYLKPEADKAAVALTRNTSEILTPYRCPTGHGWHVGHKI